MTQFDDATLTTDARDLLSAWTEARGEDAMPDPSWIGPINLRPWIRDVSIVNVEAGDRRFYVALQGERIATYFARDFHRRYIEDVAPPKAFDAYLAPYRESIARMEPIYVTFAQSYRNSVLTRLNMLVLPFGGTGEGVVERFVVWIAPESEKPVPEYDGSEDYPVVLFRIDGDRLEPLDIDPRQPPAPGGAAPGKRFWRSLFRRRA